MHVIKLRGDSLNYAAHAGIGCINLAEIAYVSVPTKFGDSNRVLQLGDIDSDESFPIICPGSSSCDEERLGPSEQPSDDQCRASHLRREDGQTVLHKVARLGEELRDAANALSERLGYRLQM